MNYPEAKRHRDRLRAIAHRVMLERGLLPDFSNAIVEELQRLHVPSVKDDSIRDLTELLWCSIDNDDSRDLDQLTVAQALTNGIVKIFVAVADVDALVKPGSAIDVHARHNTTSVYTAAEIFPMLPERLSTDLTSLNEGVDRLALVVEMTIAAKGDLGATDVYRAAVVNHAKLAYNGVADWLDGETQAPGPVTEVPGLAENLRLQDRMAQKLKALRREHGALDLETIEPRAVFDGDQIKDLEPQKKNRAKDIIEDFMIAANGVTARYLESQHFPSFRRVVRTPRRWERIVEIAAEHGFDLPGEPDAQALEKFLERAKAADPIRFPDLSLSVIKLLGPGEYVADTGSGAPGHFSLAVKDYSHSTAPNRRYPDLITQRLLKAAMAGARVPYTNEELTALAQHCTEAEDAARKVERQVVKSAAALLLQKRIGERFDAFVTGASEKGTWVRLLHPPIEGKLINGFNSFDVGQRLYVELVRVDVERGFIDFRPT
jgi:VacB/RNase II family 3'-5' exoribonuclease